MTRIVVNCRYSLQLMRDTEKPYAEILISSYLERFFSRSTGLRALHQIHSTVITVLFIAIKKITKYITLQRLQSRTISYTTLQDYYAIQLYTTTGAQPREAKDYDCQYYCCQRCEESAF